MASVLTVLTMVMSSTIFAVCGSSSLIQVPLSPCSVELEDRGATGSEFWPEVMPVIRWPLRMESGQFGAGDLRQLRLVIEQVDLRGRARLVKIDDALGLGSEVRQSGKSARFRISRVVRRRAPDSAARRVPPRQCPCWCGRSNCRRVSMKFTFANRVHRLAFASSPLSSCDVSSMFRMVLVTSVHAASSAGIQFRIAL